MASSPLQDHELRARTLQDRIGSFATEPLHSAAYLDNITSYLTKKLPRSTRSGRYRAPLPAPSEKNFLYTYKITGSNIGQPSTYKEPSQFSQTAANHEDSELVFLTGYPSAEWASTIVDRFGLDPRFMHSHLDFLPSGQRDWYTTPNVPSRNHNMFRLMIPSIVFIGPEGHSLSVDELHEARISCAAQLRSKAKGFFSSLGACSGQSIVRQVNIHRGDALVLEQVISVGIVGDSPVKKVIVWSDAGQDASDIPIPNTSNYKGSDSNIEYCPVFFENKLPQKRPTVTGLNDESKPKKTQQPLAVLPSRYGETMDWKLMPEDPLTILQELFQFQAVAAGQYLNMLRRLTTELITQIHPTGRDAPTMDDILHFEYTKTVLVRWSAHFKALQKRLDIHLARDGGRTPEIQKHRLKTHALIQQDLKYLQDEAELLINLCDSGKSTIMGSFSVYASRRAASESNLVTKLTKATNRITLIFLPISLVTSIFGMNFRQFGQGPLSITLWVSVSLPLLLLCVIISEWGGSLFRFSKAKLFGRPSISTA